MTKSERSRLEQTLGQFVGAMVGARYDEVVGFLPPGVVAELAERGGVDEETFRTGMASETATGMQEVELRLVQFHTTMMQVGEGSDGEPYALVPLSIEMDIGDARYFGRSHTFAHLENGEWYLLRVEDELHKHVLLTAYPQYEDVQFIPETLEEIEKEAAGS